MNNKNYETCKFIAMQLEKYASGDYFEYDGQLYPLDSDHEYWRTGNNSYYLENDGYYYYEIDGVKINESDVESASLFDYFSDYYNINYILDSNKELIAVRVMVACGGPNIYINTWDKQVELFWWTESAKYYLSCDVCDAINGLFQELYSC